MANRRLLAKLSQRTWKVLSAYLKAGVNYDDSVPGGVIAVQTFGDFQNFNPHLHIIATDGCFYGNGLFIRGPHPAAKDLEDVFRREVFALLKKEGLITDFVIDNMMNPADGGTELTSIAVKPSGRAMKKGWRTWHDTLSGPRFHRNG